MKGVNPYEPVDRGSSPNRVWARLPIVAIPYLVIAFVYIPAVLLTSFISFGKIGELVVLALAVVSIPLNLLSFCSGSLQERTLSVYSFVTHVLVLCLSWPVFVQLCKYAFLKLFL
jgi:hypothetical protein